MRKKGKRLKKKRFRLTIFLFKQARKSKLIIVVRKIETHCLKIVSISKMNESVDSKL